MPSYLDPRITPARPDLAAAHLEGKVEAARFVAGQAREVIDAQAPMRRAPAPDAEQVTEALMGERVTIYEFNDEGWAWGQLDADGYVGWLPANALVPPRAAATHTVTALRTLAFPGPSIKLPPVAAPPLGSRLAVLRMHERFAVTDIGYVPAGHLAPLEQHENDFVAVAERFLGTPYLWGGKTNSGLDCSALVQVALNACGIAAPRDSDMQERALGALVTSLSTLRARRSRVLEGPCGDRARRRDVRARQRLSHGGRDRADRAGDRTHPRGGQRRDERAPHRLAFHMPLLVHIASEKDIGSIRRAGIRIGQGRNGLYAMPVLRNFMVSHQWLRELKRTVRARSAPCTSASRTARRC